MRLALFTLSIASTLSLDNGVGITPLLGFNSWNVFACNVNETVLMKTMVSLRCAPYSFNCLATCECLTFSFYLHPIISP